MPDTEAEPTLSICIIVFLSDRSAERWLGNGSPGNSLWEWSSSFQPVAIKRVPWCASARPKLELQALRAVLKEMQKTPGPHHLTELVEDWSAEQPDGKHMQVIVTK